MAWRRIGSVLADVVADLAVMKEATAHEVEAVASAGPFGGVGGPVKLAGGEASGDGVEAARAGRPQPCACYLNIAMTVH